MSVLEVYVSMMNKDGQISQLLSSLVLYVHSVRTKMLNIIFHNKLQTTFKLYKRT